MAINLITLKCPECGELLDVEEGRNQLYCEHCGAHIVVDKVNENVNRTIDEAEIKKVEKDYVVEMTKLKLSENKRGDAVNFAKIKLLISASLFGLGIIFIIIGFSINGTGLDIAGMLCVLIGLLFFQGDNIGSEANLTDRAKIPDALEKCKKMNYKTVEKLLTGAGFKNVTTIALNDLVAGILVKQGQVARVTIDDGEISAGSWYDINEPIIIEYHSLANTKD